MSNYLRKAIEQHSIKLNGGDDPISKRKLYDTELTNDESNDLDNIVELKAALDFHVSAKNNKINITNENFKDKTMSLIMFYKNSCPFCHNFMPQFKMLNEMYNDKVGFGIYNIDDIFASNEILASYLKINAVPTVYSYDGRDFKMYEGKKDIKNLAEYICTKTGFCKFNNNNKPKVNISYL